MAAVLYVFKRYPEQVGYYTQLPETWVIMLALLAVALWNARRVWRNCERREKVAHEQEELALKTEFTSREFEVARVLVEQDGHSWEGVEDNPFFIRRYLESARKVLGVV